MEQLGRIFITAIVTLGLFSPHVLMPGGTARARISEKDMLPFLAVAANLQLASFDPACGPSAGIVSCDWNSDTVSNGPTSPTIFTIATARRVAEIIDYHYPNGPATGTISLQGEEDGRVFGPWKITASIGFHNTPNVIWTARFHTILLPAGTYRVIDSSPATWSFDEKSGGQGFSEVREFDPASLAPQVNFDPACGPSAGIVSCDWNSDTVSNGPTSPTIFTIATARRVAEIIDYHYPNGPATGTISLQGEEDGRVFGPWKITASIGFHNTPNVIWTARFHTILLPAGTYRVIDSSPATWSFDEKSGGQGFSEVREFDPASLSPVITPPWHGPERLDCQTQDIRALSVKQYDKKTKKQVSISIYATRLPYRYTGIVATFCDNDLSEATKDYSRAYSANVLWNVSFEPKSSLYAPAGYGDLDPYSTIIRIGPGRFAIKSSFVIQSVGYIRIAIKINKNVDGGGFAAVESLAKVTAPENCASAYNGATSAIYDKEQAPFARQFFLHSLRFPTNCHDAKGQPPLLSNKYDAAYNAAYLNETDYIGTYHQNDKISLDIEPHSHVSNNARRVVSALAGGVDRGACYRLSSSMQDNKYAALLALSIASNVAAADAYFECNGGFLLGDDRSTSRIAVTAFLDHLDDYANCDLMQHFGAQSNPSCNIDLLQRIVSSATSIDPNTSAPYHQFILERGVALWIDTRLPHPIVFCNPLHPNCAANPNVETEAHWASGIGLIFGALTAAIQGHFATSDKAAADAKVLEGGMVFCALGIAIAAPPLWESVPALTAYIAQSGLSLSLTYVSTYIAPPPSTSTLLSSPDAAMLGAARSLAILLIQSRSLWDVKRDKLVIANDGDPFDRQINKVVDDWTSHTPGCGKSRYHLVNQRLEETSYTACADVFNKMGLGALMEVVQP